VGELNEKKKNKLKIKIKNWRGGGEKNLGGKGESGLSRDLGILGKDGRS
jgi:hypothetical protein